MATYPGFTTKKVKGGGEVYGCNGCGKNEDGADVGGHRCNPGMAGPVTSDPRANAATAAKVEDTKKSP